MFIPLKAIFETLDILELDVSLRSSHLTLHFNNEENEAQRGETS